MIIEAFDAVWLAELEDGQMGFMNVTALELIQHLETYRGGLDAMDVEHLKNDQDIPYKIMEHSIQYFSHVEQQMKSLV